MILTLDIGNTHITGAVFDSEKTALRFRTGTKTSLTSDDLGIFMRSVLRENGIALESIQGVSACTVVPDLLYSVNSCVKRYFGKKPFFLQAGVKTGLKIKYKDPSEVGSDRIANAVAGVTQFPNKNLIIIDFGTATTFCAVSKSKEYMGGTIMPGVRISMESLETKTAKLPKIEIISADKALGRSTVESLQSGLYYNQLGAAREITVRLSEECFRGEGHVVIGTGGFSRLFDKEDLFDVLSADLVHRGLLEVYRKNT